MRACTCMPAHHIFCVHSVFFARFRSCRSTTRWESSPKPSHSFNTTSCSSSLSCSSSSRWISFLDIHRCLGMCTLTRAPARLQWSVSTLISCLVPQGCMFAAHALFGDRLPQYATLSGSLSTTLNGLANGIDYDPLNEVSDAHADVMSRAHKQTHTFILHQVNAAGAPLFFYAFILIVLFVCLNVTIAIILEGYSQAKAEVCSSANVSRILSTPSMHMHTQTHSRTHLHTHTQREEHEAGDLADLCHYHIFTQIYRGATRRLTYIRPLYITVISSLPACACSVSLCLGLGLCFQSSPSLPPSLPPSHSF